MRKSNKTFKEKQRECYYIEKKDVEKRYNINKKGLTGTVFALGTVCALTSGLMGIILHNKNQPVQPMLIPAIVSLVSYGSIGKIGKNYDKSLQERLKEIRKRYDIKE